MTPPTVSVGSGYPEVTRVQPRMPELRFRWNQWLSYSCEEAVVVLTDALGRGEGSLNQIRVEFLGTHREPLSDLPEDGEAVSPLPGTP
jgi:hypothetical protein